MIITGQVCRLLYLEISGLKRIFLALRTNLTVVYTFRDPNGIISLCFYKLRSMFLLFTTMKARYYILTDCLIFFLFFINYRCLPEEEK